MLHLYLWSLLRFILLFIESKVFDGSNERENHGEQQKAIAHSEDDDPEPESEEDYENVRF